ncbi:dihydrolipoyl dehydrogenase [Mycoplasma procyoni]|uniref:dihydrolipoyl dehydrogenase n=1 Tax=Mycoplasma procyoni TaxID=568784 RepID=UPI00197B7541|nr:dihydrolipoyl dehydrogenase [Mycoplasma procyoni]MBN3535115.1 dihydrolipoyl dehydrogenase [Mycoplasma procyoni]
MKKFDVAIIGAGPGGYSLANILAQNGKSVALFEKKHLGGTCVNEGCISTKTLIKSAKVLDTLKHAEDFGLKTASFHSHFNQIQKRRIENKQLLNGAIEKSLVASGVEIFWGEAEVLDKNTLQFKDQKINFDKLVLATGSSSRFLELKGFKEASQKGLLINSTDALELQNQPKTLNIIGSGPISLEFAYFYSTLGTKVTILEARKFLQTQDLNIQQSVRAYLEEKGVEIIEDVNLVEFKDNKLVTEINSKTREFEAEKTLLAVGRIPNTDSFKKLGVQLDPRGFVKVDQTMKTNIENVYAIGDVTGLFMLSTVAYKTGDIVAKDILGHKNNELFDAKTTPWSVYLNPEFSGVGETEQQLKSRNAQYKAIVLPAAALPRAHADGLDKKHGFVKFLIDLNTEEILGSFMFLEGSHLIINEIALAMRLKLKFSDLQSASYTHPTVAEAIYYATRGFAFSKK